MKQNIHPAYHPQAQISCACGTTFTAGSIMPHIPVEICSTCHPFYTGEMKYVDTAGRVDKFKAKIQTAQQTTYIKKKEKKQAKLAAQKAALEAAPQTMKEMIENFRKQTQNKSKTVSSQSNKSATDKTITSDQSSDDSYDKQ